VSHVCLNDDVVEGLELRNADGRLTAFSVQYHPEAAAGPHDAAYLFDRFVSLIEEGRSPVTRSPEAPADPSPGLVTGAGAPSSTTGGDA
jgi:carbamoyl-phosphate synthase small subunit